jgi:hypothetical protein
MKFKKITLIIASWLLGYWVIGLLLGYWVFGLNMRSDSYQIQMGNVNMGGERKESSSYAITDTMGQIAPGEYLSTGYRVLAGFPYIRSLIPFSFTISDISIDFGALKADFFNEETNNLTVSCGSAGGYQVTVLADKQLTSGGGVTIPKTTCGATACNLDTAQPWTSVAYYGFGYNLSGDDIPGDFIDSTYFRPFPDQESNNSAQIIMNGSNIGHNLQSTVVYRINISSLQEAGSYENRLTFVATPTF